MASDIYPISPAILKNTYTNEMNYRKWYEESLNDPETFWGTQAKKFITWNTTWNKVLSGDFNQVDIHWFQGGKLNATHNCLDRHLKTHASEPAIIWESDSPNLSKTITYQELYENVCRFANVLKRYGIKKGSRVCLYLPMIPEAVVAMLACARIGAIHSVVVGGFSAESLKNRILDAKCQLVITANEGVRGNKIIPLKQQVDAALRDCKEVKTVIVVKRTENMVPWDHKRDMWYQDVISQAPGECHIEIMNAEDPLFILYTSGSTGKPKGILHGTGGYLVYAAMTHHYIFDYHPSEIYWCTADIGWITGHTYSVYGPLLNRATTLLFEGVPNYPTPARFFEIIDKHQVNIFYTAPTAIRALRREGNSWVKQTKRKSLRILGTVGEPIDKEAWKWYHRIVGEGRCPIVDTWWQTETGGVMISAFPGATPLKAGSAAWPFFGISPKIIDEEGREVENGTMGHLVISKPWPGMMQTVYGDHDRFLNTYFKPFPGYYLTGDQAYKDAEGYFWIAGRSDDVIKVSGHRIGTQEVEKALIHHLSVAEAAVVAIPDSIKGQSIYAFVTLKLGFKSSEELKKELIKTVREGIGPIAAPEHIQFTEGLPKTRSGKIMRRLLRKIASNDFKDLGDLSTLADPSVVDQMIKEKKSKKA